MLKIRLVLSLSLLLLFPLAAELPEHFHGFVLTGYSRNAYGNSSEVSGKLLTERYGKQDLVIPVLVTFYVDTDTGSVSPDSSRTPAPDQVAALMSMIRKSGNLPALAFYLDPAVTGKAALTDRRALTRIDFGQWYSLMETYIRSAERAGATPKLIILSPEMTGLESADWTPFLVRLKKRAPAAGLAYCTWPLSPLLAGGSLPGWIGELDYFGSTLILSSDSGHREEILINAEITLARIVETSRRAGVRPFVGEAGFPSHKGALSRAWTGDAPPEEADPPLQAEILGEITGQLEQSGVSWLFWRIAPAEMGEDADRTDFCWLTGKKDRDGTVRFRDKPAARIVDRVLLSRPPVYRTGKGDPVGLEENRIVTRRPFGVIKPGGGYQPSRSSAIDYETAPERIYSFPLNHRTKRIRYRVSGYSWSGQSRKYNAGKVIIRVQSEDQYQNNDGYDRIIELPWEPAEISGIWDITELFDFAPLEKLTLKIIPSDYGLIVKYLDIILEEDN